MVTSRLDTRYAKEYALFYRSSGYSLEQAYCLIFNKPMPYARKVLDYRSFFNRGY
jgi:hypothetical protein